MSQKITKDQVLKLAQLARLKLTEAEVDKYTSELDSILEYVSLLDEADTEGLEPTSQVTGLVNVFREDKVREQEATPKELLQRAPESKDGYIKVRRML